MVSLEKHPATYVARKKVCVRKEIWLYSWLENYVCSELYLKHLKMLAIVQCQGQRSAGKKVHRDIQIATLNVGTMRGRSNEIVEILSRRLIDICCVQESR